MKWILLPLAALALLAIGSNQLWRNTLASAPPARALPTAAIPADISANGVVEGARPEMALRPEIPGVLARVGAHENQMVQRGELLAELNNDAQKQQVALARAQLEVAKGQLQRLVDGERQEKRRAAAALEKARYAAYQQARADWQRGKQLVGEGALTQEQFDAEQFTMLRAEAQWQEAKAERALIEAPARDDEVAVARARVAAAEARLRLAEAELAKTRVLAPSAGRVLQVYAEVGEMAGPTTVQPVLLMANVSHRRVRAFVEELDACRVQAGQRAKITADGLPGREFFGRVSIVVARMGKRTPQSDAPGEYKDVYFREVLIDLDQGDELPLNLRVQVSIEASSKESRS